MIVRAHTEVYSDDTHRIDYAGAGPRSDVYFAYTTDPLPYQAGRLGWYPTQEQAQQAVDQDKARRAEYFSYA